MTDEETRLTDAAWITYRSGKTLSKSQLDLLLNVFASREFNLEVPQQQDVGVIKMRMGEIFGRWIPQAK